MLIRDKATVSTRTKLPNGFLRVDAVLARTGIQLYSAGELGLTDRKASETVRVWRPRAEVFKPESIASFSMVPLTDNHPADGVDIDNARHLTVGWTGDNPRQAGDLMESRLLVSDAKAIGNIEKGKVELSNGYDCDLEWTSGTVPDGERDAGQAYDCVMRNIIGNHVALVDAGRCGADCKVQDTEHQARDCASETCNCRGDEAMADKALTKMVVDGFGLVEVTDDAKAVIEALTKKAADAAAEVARVQGAADAAAAAHTDAITAKDTEIADLKTKADDTATLDARVEARAKLIADARKIGGDDLKTDGLSDAEVRKAAVTAHMGEDKVKDKAPTYFDGAFDFLVDSGASADGAGETPQTPSGLRDALRPDTTQHRNDDAKGESYEDRMSKRWKKVAA